MAKTVYSDEVKAAVTAALLQGQSVGSVAREYKIPRGTASSWKERASTPAAATDATQKAEVGTLLLDYLRANLRALAVQATLFADRGWLAEQDAQQLAVMHGIMTDKAVRMLEAMGDPGDAAGRSGS